MWVVWLDPRVPGSVAGALWMLTHWVIMSGLLLGAELCPPANPHVEAFALEFCIWSLGF